jgi:nitrogen fixation/metabolism regulation signal transduction histidine kinase
MQKRLFWIFFPMMFIPALLAMMIDWQNSREQLAVLDGPGLAASFDASLELARQVLTQEKSKAQQQADGLAGGQSVETGGTIQGGDTGQPGLWWQAQITAGGQWELTPKTSDSLPDSLLLSMSFDPSALESPVRRNWPQGVFLIASAKDERKQGSWVVVAWPLPGELVDLLDQVAQGTTGVRQLRLFYSRLLRSNLMVNLGILTALLFVVSFVLSRRLSRYIARPLQELSQGTERVAAGDLSHRVQVKAPAELGLLVMAFNRMTAQLQKGRDDLRRAEQVAAWQGVARRLAHEIKNPLTPINLAMHRIGRKSTDETVISCVETVLEEAANLGRLADEFSLYAKLPEPQPQPMNSSQLQELLESLAQFYLARTRVDFSWISWPGSFTLSVDPGQLRQVLSNLIKNGNEAMAGQGILEFELAMISEPGVKVDSNHNGGWVRLIIRDSGPGLAENTDRVFEPYFTSKSTGTGLGLAVARRIIEDNGGCLWARSSAGGASFIIDLPDLSECIPPLLERNPS